MSKKNLVRQQQSAAERLGMILKGAFQGSPTPLKEIPKRDGGRRKLKSTNRSNKKNSRKRKIVA